MPTVLPISEMQRNAASLADQAMSTKEPIYLTRHGRSAVVVMDAEEYDRQMAFKSRIVEREERILSGIMAGHDEIQRGEGIPAADVLDQLRKKWGSPEEGDVA